MNAQRFEEEYRQWMKAHNAMKDSPPVQGWDYLMHAKNLLSLLESVADIHPIAKAVITGFKTVVMFEKDRRDNDVRVTAVFLSQTDTMQVLLDIADLANCQKDREDIQGLRSNAMLGSVLERIAKDIKECGNSIDAYYKESRFVKFWKSQDWKDRMLGYVEDFSKHRAHLLQIVSIQVASGVGDLVSKMNDVMSRLYKPKSGWEKELDDQTHRLGDPIKWLDDEPTLRSMVALTDDPTLPVPPLGQENRSDFLVKSRLEKVRMELEMSLDVICERNMDRFELRLNFFAYQMQEAIQESTHTIVQALSGPFDRLENEDLRELWREMDWIFCVDNKLFSSALFEYYLDRFSGRKASSADIHKNVKSGVTPRSKFSSVNHVDSWTLEYLANYNGNIAAAIDTDGSGFIRISEANAFTRRMPTEWNLPRWCAYSAAGWSFEARIYRKRINNLLFKLIEMQSSVLPENLETLFCVIRFPIILNICHAFWREPKSSIMNRPPISLELKELVKEKIISQDTSLRTSLDSLKWTIDDVSTVDLLFGDALLESYILQLCTIMLESLLQFVVQTCCSVPLSLSDLNRAVTTFDIMRQISVARVESLKANFVADHPKELFPEYINQYHGGIWSFFNANPDYKLPEFLQFLDEYSTESFSLEEYRDYIADKSILADFPLPALPNSRSRSFEETRPPKSQAITKESQALLSAADNFGFPPTGWSCNLCETIPIAEQRYHCIECFDMDLCEKCFNLPKEQCVVESHRFDHPILVITLDFLGQQFRILEEESNYHLEGFQQFLRARNRSNESGTSKRPTTGSKEGDQSDLIASNSEPSVQDVLLTCSTCSQGVHFDHLFYKCVGHSCEEFYVCEKCAVSKEDVDGRQHKWWHNLLTIRRDIVEYEAQRRPSLDSAPGPPTDNTVGNVASQEKESLRDFIVSAINTMVEERTVLESNLKANNMALNERMSRLEDKMDKMMFDLKEWLSIGRNPQ